MEINVAQGYSPMHTKHKMSQYLIFTVVFRALIMTSENTATLSFFSFKEKKHDDV